MIYADSAYFINIEMILRKYNFYFPFMLGNASKLSNIFRLNLKGLIGMGYLFYNCCRYAASVLRRA